MSLKTTVVTEELDNYLQDKFSPSDNLIQKISRIAEIKGMPHIHISGHQAKYLQFLIKSINAKNILEIGSLAGYSAISMASVLPDCGKLITVELEKDYAELVNKNAEEAGLSDKIEVINSDARNFVNNFNPTEKLDFVFVDADKPGYYHYLTALTPHIRKGGIFAADNAFAFGFVLQSAPERNPEDVKSIKSFNEKFISDPNYFVTLVPIGDGLIIGLKITG